MTKEDWVKLGGIYSSAERVKENLQKAGFDTLISLNVGVFPAMFNIIIKRKGCTIFSECVLNALKDDAKVDKILSKCMELLDSDELEKAALRKRLAELEGYE